jgi:uncharacterized membrane protein (DUF485 family)
MKDDLVARVRANPKYQALKQKRNVLGWTLSAVMLVVYYGYILLIAFDKELLATRLGDGVTTIGIPVGLGVIAITIALTGYYVWRANSEFDGMTDDIIKEEAGK